MFGSSPRNARPCSRNTESLPEFDPTGAAGYGVWVRMSRGRGWGWWSVGTRGALAGVFCSCAFWRNDHYAPGARPPGFNDLLATSPHSTSSGRVQQGRPRRERSEAATFPARRRHRDRPPGRLMLSAGSCTPGDRPPGRLMLSAGSRAPGASGFFGSLACLVSGRFLGEEVVVAASSRLRGKDLVSPNAQLQNWRRGLRPRFTGPTSIHGV
jgi:hypothetical protein